MANAVQVFRTEYYESKIGKWIALYEGFDLNHAMLNLDTPITGNPSKRVAEYNKTGIRKIKYSLVRVVA